MDLEALAGLNWLAVITGAALYFALGAIWFQPQLLGRAWMRSIGWDPSRGQPDASVVSYLPSLVAYLVAATAVGLLAAATGSDNLAAGITLGLVIGIGLALTLTAVDASFDPIKPHPWSWFAISGMYHLLGLLMVAVLVSVWG